MAEKFINIRFPFAESDKGYFLQMNKTSEDAIKSDLVHLLLTKKGERLYLPEFGTDLLKFIFEPNDNFTKADLKREVQNSIDMFIPNLRVDEILVEPLEQSEHAAKIKIDYTITEDVFETKETIILTI